MKFTIYQNSRQGPRPYNEDRLAYSYSKDSLLMVVADGMGGHRHGEVAAQLAVKSLTDGFQNLAIPTLPNPAKFLEEHILQVHDAIDSLTLGNDLSDSPRTTVVAAIVQDGKLYAAHVGDSRLYHFRNGQLIFRTEDHSIVQMLYRKGQLRFEDMANHPDLHKIYNCLGGDKVPNITLSGPRALIDGDVIFLCTDGVWSAVNDHDIGKLLHAGGILDSVPKLLNIAETVSEEHGDNMSAIGLQWGDRQNSQVAVSTATMPLGMTTTIINPVTQQLITQMDESAMTDLSDDEIERTILEIQSAISKTKQGGS
ncbi:MAG: serine/threonine-protein phosphatase [Betaproteobacteria bacterium HGW-Betaproteobacteria-8]|nr:MAG: serine/threonine-protein phosphatase [Betaproteobacteria bacterium HGW-Betaproteobacteria-8]